MKVYVQGEKSLIPIQEEVTAESIEEALGYVPADAEDIIECIEESEDFALYVTDKDGNIITKTDGEGFHTNSIISAKDALDLCVTDKGGNIITKTDGSGFHATEIYIGDENGEKTVAEMISEAVGDVNPDATYVSETTFEEHTSDTSHITDDERTAWNNKSDLDDIVSKMGDSNFYIVDKDGRIIMKVGNGLHTTEVYIGDENGEKTVAEMISEAVKGIAADGGSACDHEYVTIQELIRNRTDCTTWKDLQYCSSCGKVHANLLHSDHERGGWYTQVEPTCIETGTKRRDCDRDGCDWYETEEVPALGHDWDVEVEVVEPTCTTGGYTIHTCNGCGDTYTDNATDPLGHNMVTVAAQDPTSTSIGWSEYQKCSRCDYKEGYEEIPMLTRYPLTIKLLETAYTPMGQTITQVLPCGTIIETVASEIDADETLEYTVNASRSTSGWLTLKIWKQQNATCTLTLIDSSKGEYKLTITKPTGAVTVEIS